MSHDPDNEPPDFRAYNHRENALLDKWNLFDKAAKKDLHWWFFALLMIGMAGFAFLYSDMRKDREAMRVEIQQLRTDQLAYVTVKSEAMMAALLNNTRALEANTQTLNRLENRKP